MTVETTDRKQNFAGGQANLEFNFRALPESPEDIKCLATSGAGAGTLLEYNVDYTVTVNSDGIGGTVVVNPTFDTTYTHTVYRETTIKQESDYDDYNAFPANTLETNIDRLTLIAQELEETEKRTLKYPISASGTDTSLPVPEAGSFIAWSDDETKLVNKDIPDPSTLVKASQAQAEAGTDNDTFMTPLQTKNAIGALESDDVPLSYLSTSATLAENSDVKVPSQKAVKTYTLPLSYLDTDGTLAANSDVKVPSQKAVKTYVDGKGLGDASSKSNNTVYEAETDGFVLAYIALSNNTGNVLIKSDSDNPPATLLMNIGGTSLTAQWSLSCPIKKGNYYKIEAGGTIAQSSYYFVPLS